VVHVRAGVLEQLVGATEHNESDLTVAQDAQFVRLLHQPELTLRERHLQSVEYDQRVHTCLSVMHFVRSLTSSVERTFYALLCTVAPPNW